MNDMVLVARQGAPETGMPARYSLAGAAHGKINEPSSREASMHRLIPLLPVLVCSSAWLRLSSSVLASMVPENDASCPGEGVGDTCPAHSFRCRAAV
jgi:hypothetical protein